MSGQAPPPTGTAARPSGPSGALHTSGAWVADRQLGLLARCPARPRRPGGGLQSVGVSVCCLARPRRRPSAPRQVPLVPPHQRRGSGVSVRAPPDLRPPQLTLTNFARNSPATVSNLEFVSLEWQRFLCLLKDLVIELRATFQGLSPMQASGPRPQETATGLVLRATGLGSLAQSGSGERNTAPAWCSSSWHDASLKQKPPTRAQNCRKVVSSSVPGRIMFHGAPEQPTHGRIFFHTSPVYGHRIHQQSSDWGA